MDTLHASTVHRVRIAFGVLALAGSLAADSARAAAHAGAGRSAAGVREYSIEQFLSTTGLRGASFSHDESRILFSSNASGIWNAYTMPTVGGEPVPVTRSTTDNNYAVSYFPADDRILYTRDRGG